MNDHLAGVPGSGSCILDHPMFQNKKAVIFDLDGTLLDSMSLWHDIDVEYLGMFGLSVPDDLMRSIAGMAFHEVAVYFQNRFHITDPIETIMQVWDEMAYRKYATEIGLKPCAREFLSLLKENGYRIGIATSNSRRLLMASLDAHGIADYFHFMCTADETIKGKPDPDVYLEAAKGLHIAPEDCLVFEDIPVGILAGKRAHMTVCAVGDRFSDDQKQEKMELADFYIESFAEFGF